MISKCWRNALLISVAGLACTSIARGSEVLEQEKIWLDGFRRADAAAMASVYSQDGVAMPPNAEAVQGRKAIEAALAKMLMPGLVSQTTTLEIIERGDIAIRRGSYILRDAAGTVLDRGKMLEMWQKKEGGKWELARDMWSSDLSPAAPK